MSLSFNNFFNLGRRLFGDWPMHGNPPLSADQFHKIWRDQPSFTDFLPWVDFDPDHEVFLFDDAINVGALFEITPVDTDGRPNAVGDRVANGLARALATLPQKEDAPLIVQFYLTDEQPFGLMDRIRQYRSDHRTDAPHWERTDPYAAAWFEELSKFIGQATDGLFQDTRTKKIWRLRAPTVRLAIYRLAKTKSGKTYETSANELNQSIAGFIASLEQDGIAPRRCDETDLYRWMVPWLSPAPGGLKSGEELIKTRACPNRDDRGFGFDLGQMVTTTPPAPADGGIWLFNDAAQRFITLQPLDAAPVPGQLTTARAQAYSNDPSPFESLPAGSIFCQTVVIQPQFQVKAICEALMKVSGAGSHQGAAAEEQAEGAIKEMALGNLLFPMFSGVFLRADSIDTIRSDTTQALAILRTRANLSPIDADVDPIAQDSYLRALPMVFSPEHDQRTARRGHLTYANHIARIAPVYGRSTGSGRPGLFYFTRDGQPFMVDPMDKRDRVKTAHALLFGTTGAGKSAALVYQSMHAMAVHRTRQFFLEKGESFSLLQQFYELHGLSTLRAKFSANTKLNLPPYAFTRDALAQIDRDKELAEPKSLNPTEVVDLDTNDGDPRDYVGEMELLTQLMVTGADPKELENLDRSAKRDLQHAIVTALNTATSNGAPHARPSDVHQAITHMADGLDRSDNKRKDRLRELAAGMELWTTGQRGRVFNRHGEAWPDVDATFIDLGNLVSDNNADQLAVAVISLINTITGVAERDQASGREIQFYMDEAHIITKTPGLVRPVVFGVKTWRKLGCWLIQATQNLDDYPDEAAAMLALAEWWFLLSMPPSEIDQVAKFRTLTQEDRTMILQAQKESGRFVEGVVMSDKVNAPFRSVLPSIALALAQTDPDEKAARRKIMDEQGCTEIDAVFAVARQIDQARESA